MIPSTSFNKSLFFKYFLISVYLIKIIKNHGKIDEILCSFCNHKITNSLFLTNEYSKVALDSKMKFRFNKSILVHTFNNPQKIKFQVITTKKANLVCDRIEYEDSTFFDGFTWRICTCPVCGSHHGWLFSPIDGYCDNIKGLNKTVCSERRKFYGLITTRLKDSQFTGEKIDL